MISKKEQLLLANPWFDDFFAVGKMEINVLIVADGFISFVESEFGLSELIYKGLLPSATPWENLKIVKAHRAEEAKGSNILSFRFDKIPDPPYDFPLTHYDEIWLFGSESEKVDGKPNKLALSESELRELSNFMNNGGGVFATGDHEDLGAALCGEVPRVRSMRKWFFRDSPPPKYAETRLDTLREGIDQGFIASDQADATPQEIRPIFKLNGARTGSFPHRLLRKDIFAITVLPDHMHEGECVLPKDLEANICLGDGTSFKEYPPLRVRDERLPPEVVAISTSAAGFEDDLELILPVIPRCFINIVAYDGHQCTKAGEQYKNNWTGRVVVDSSFHHFVDINLRGTSSGSKLKTGLYDLCDNPTRDYVAIKQYYRNLLLWLLPPEKQIDYYLNMLLACRYLSPLTEEVRVLDNPDFNDIVLLGKSTRRTIATVFSRDDALQCAIHASTTLGEDVHRLIRSIFEPWEATSPVPVDATLFNLELIPNFLLGGAMLGFAKNLPQTPIGVRNKLAYEEKDRSEQLRGIVFSGVHQAATVFGQVALQTESLFAKVLGRLTSL